MTLRPLRALLERTLALGALEAALRPFGALRPLERALALDPLDTALRPLGALGTALLLALGALLLRRLCTGLAAVAALVGLLSPGFAAPVATVAPIAALSVGWNRQGHDSRTGQKHQFAHF